MSSTALKTNSAPLSFLGTVNSGPEWGCLGPEFECCFLSVGSAKIGGRIEEFGA